MAVIALIRDAQGGGDSGLIIVFLVPIVWLALYGRRLHVVVGLLCLYLALALPILVIGPPKYPHSEWRQAIAMAAVTTLVALTVFLVVSRNRVYVRDLVHQTKIARLSALGADQARDRLEALLRAATGSAIMGVDPAGRSPSSRPELSRCSGTPRPRWWAFVPSRTSSIRPRLTSVARPSTHYVATPSHRPIPRPWPKSPGRPHERTARSVAAWYGCGPCLLRSSTTHWVATALPPPATPPTRQPNRCPLSGVGPPSPEDASAATSYVVVAIDVTEREELAAERERIFSVQREVTQSFIQQNRRLRELTQMKDDVVATVSHELRTPITSIRGFIELLLDDAPELTEEQVRMLRTIHRSSEQLQRVAEDLLADPGGGAGLTVAFTDLDLRDLTADAVDSFQTAATTAGVTISLAADHGVPVFGDPTRLHQLVGNLISNAIKFSPRGGRVQVVVDSADTFARVQVLDEGPGVPEAERPQLFERFYRLASTTESGVPGSGLGLAIAKSVAEAHEGFLDIVDTPGWSTTFRIFLPLQQAAQPGVHPGGHPAATSMTA